jgi:hypothetical protein
MQDTVNKSNFDKVARDFASVSPETIHIVTERISHGDSITANNNDERKVLNLMKQVNAVDTTYKCACTDAAILVKHFCEF